MSEKGKEKEKKKVNGKRKESGNGKKKIPQKNSQINIAIIASGEMYLAPMIAYGVLKSRRLRGSKITLIDGQEERLDATRSAVERVSKSLGNSISIEGDTDVAHGVRNVDYVILAGENGRALNVKDDYNIPLKYGSKQTLGKDGGPGSIFRSLRNIKHVIDTCKMIEKKAPDALLINMIHPMSSVMLAISRGTNLKSVVYPMISSVAFFVLPQY